MSTANLEVWNAGGAGVVGLLHLAKNLRADGEDHLGNDQPMDPQHPSGPAAVPITTVAAVVAEPRQPEPAPAAPAAAVAAQTAGAHRRIAPLSPPPLQRGYIHIGRSSPRAPDTRFRSARAGGDSAATPVDPDGDGAFASRPLPFTLSRCPGCSLSRWQLLTAAPLDCADPNLLGVPLPGFLFHTPDKVRLLLSTLRQLIRGSGELHDPCAHLSGCAYSCRRRIHRWKSEQTYSALPSQHRCFTSRRQVRA